MCFWSHYNCLRGGLFSDSVCLQNFRAIHSHCVSLRWQWWKDSDLDLTFLNRRNSFSVFSCNNMWMLFVFFTLSVETAFTNNMWIMKNTGDSNSISAFLLFSYFYCKSLWYWNKKKKNWGGSLLTRQHTSVWECGVFHKQWLIMCSQWETPRQWQRAVEPCTGTDTPSALTSHRRRIWSRKDSQSMEIVSLQNNASLKSLANLHWLPPDLCHINPNMHWIFLFSFVDISLSKVTKVSEAGNCISATSMLDVGGTENSLTVAAAEVIISKGVKPL